MVSRYESGEIKTVGIDTLIKFSNALNCSPADLMDWGLSDDSDNENIFLEKFRKLSHDDQMLLFGIMDSFIDARKSANLPATGTK